MYVNCWPGVVKPLSCARFDSRTGSRVLSKSAAAGPAQSPIERYHARTQQSYTIKHNMLLYLACLITATVAAPALYDQRQDGDFNVRADVQNVVFLVAVPQKLPFPPSLLEGFLKSAKSQESEMQDRSDVNLLEAFIEPSTPYQVEIGDSNGRYDKEKPMVEVVIAGRRRSDPEVQSETDAGDELKLLGATEQCGPDAVRDSVTMRCRTLVPEEPKPVVSVLKVAEPAPVQASPAEPVQSDPALEVVPPKPKENNEAVIPKSVPESL